jgi:hypothetical protein
VIRALAAAIVLIAIGGLAVRFGFGTILGQPPAGAATSPSPIAATPTPSPGQVSLDVSETMLTDRLNSTLVGRSLGPTPMGDAAVKHLDIRLTPDRVEASGDAAVGSTTVPVSLNGTVSVLGGAPVVSLKDASANGVPLPESARTILEESLQSNLQALLAAQHLTLSSLTVGDGKLTVVGQRS